MKSFRPLLEVALARPLWQWYLEKSLFFDITWVFERVGGYKVVKFRYFFQVWRKPKINSVLDATLESLLQNLQLKNRGLQTLNLVMQVLKKVSVLEDKICHNRKSPLSIMNDRGLKLTDIAETATGKKGHNCCFGNVKIVVYYGGRVLDSPLYARDKATNKTVDRQGRTNTEKPPTKNGSKHWWRKCISLQGDYVDKINEIYVIIFVFSLGRKLFIPSSYKLSIKAMHK